MGTLNGQTSSGLDINNRGQIVGRGDIDPGDPRINHALLWDRR
jgi:hypothetical protein